MTNSADKTKKRKFIDDSNPHAAIAEVAGDYDCTCPTKLWTCDGSDMNESTCQLTEEEHEES